VSTENSNVPSFSEEEGQKEHNTLHHPDSPVDTLPGQHEKPSTEGSTVADQPGRTGPGTGDGTDTRPLGDPDAPQGTGPEVVPGGNITAPASERPAPAGEIRTSWAESGDYKQ
jgi:hypothetical protein